MNGNGLIVLSPAYARAVEYASKVHASQVRKGTSVPYVAHLLGVSSLVLEAGGDEELAIAGLLHDAAEDHGGEDRLVDIAERFGERVSQVVRECSDSLAAEDELKADWEDRKRAHLERLHGSTDDTLVVWTADKVHNGRAMATDLEVHGHAVLSKFHASPAQILWYYRENLRLAESRAVRESLVVPLRVAVDRLVTLVRT